MNNYKPKYHFTSPSGWINDPNGFVYFKGYYHLFYQYHEGKHCGVMSWGHAISKDLVNFEELPPVITHIKDYDKDGSWSGSSYVKNNKLYILYTGHKIVDNKAVQTQNLVISDDGFNFKYYENNPVIFEKHLPENGTINDFRDPSLFKYKNMYYCMLGNKSIDNIAQLLLYKSNDLINWNFDMTLISSNELGYMIECPSMARINNKRLLIMSPQGLKDKGNDFWNVYSSIYTICSLDFNDLNIKNIYEIDHGLDFYASHCISNGNILISWFNIWERTIPSLDEDQNWTNAFTLPRKLSIKKGKMIQKPLDNLSNYFKINKIYSGKLLKTINAKGFHKHIHLEFDSQNEISVKFFKKAKYYSEVFYKNNLVTIDRRNSLIPIKSFKEEKSSLNYRQICISSKKVILDIYLDRILAEVFINNGKEVMSMTTYHPDDFNNIVIKNKGNKKVKLILKSFKNIK